MTITEPMSMGAIRKWLNAHRETVRQEARGGDKLAIALFAADVVYSNIKTVKTEVALRVAVINYQEARE